MNEIPNEPLMDNEDHLIETETAHPPSRNLLFFLLGNASLLAFNMEINGIDIYTKLISSKADSIGTDISRFYNIPCSIVSLIICVLKPKNIKLLLISALISLTSIMFLVPTLLLIKIDEDTLYYVTASFFALTGVVSALTFSSTFSMASQLGPSAGAYTSSGNGCCGVVAAALRIVIKAIFHKESQFVGAAAAYFYIADLIFLLTTIYFIITLRDPEVASRVNPPPDDSSVFSKQTVETIRVIWPLWIAECSCFLITLSIFPGYMAAVLPGSSGISSDWTPVIVTSLFCIFDWVGRYLPAHFIWPSEKRAWIPVFGRLLFYPIFILSLQKVMNVGDPYWTFVWTIPFAITNGYSGTVAMIHGTNHSKLSSECRRYAGFLMSFAINFGIFIAMWLTFAFPKPKA